MLVCKGSDGQYLKSVVMTTEREKIQGLRSRLEKRLSYFTLSLPSNGDLGHPAIISEERERKEE